MADILIYNMTHWMDAYADRDAIKAAHPGQTYIGDKYDARYQKGDIVEVQETGFWVGTRGWGYPRFVVLQVTNRTKAQALDFVKEWQRDVSIVRITNDTVNHIYEYRVTLQRISTAHDYELFSEAKDKLTKIPSDCSIVSRSATEVVFRAEPLTWPAVIAGDTTAEERIAKIEEQGKDLIKEFSKTLRRRQIRLDLDSLPAGVQADLDTQHYYANTWAVIGPYVKDKAD